MHLNKEDVKEIEGEVLLDAKEVRENPSKFRNRSFTFDFKDFFDLEEFSGTIDHVEEWRFSTVLYVTPKDLAGRTLRFLMYDEILNAWFAILKANESDREDSYLGLLVLR